MAKLSTDETAVNARILYWGIHDSGKTTNLDSTHRKLRADHRGEIQREATVIDPTVTYETLSIELGEIAGLKTRIQMIAVPGGDVTKAATDVFTRRDCVGMVQPAAAVLGSVAALL
jgi:hypothetical protein